MKVKFDRGVFAQDCGVACPGSGDHAAPIGAHRGYSENAASLMAAFGAVHSGKRDVPSTSSGFAKPASAASVG